MGSLRIMDSIQELQAALESKDAEIAELADNYKDRGTMISALVAERSGLNSRISDLERQLAEETERCVGYLVKLRETHLAKAKRTTSPSTKAAFDKAVFLGQLAAAIRGGAK
jgi:chromosome segregation ATPase